MSAIVLDTGALIALERDDRRMWTALRLSATNGEDVLVPTTALAQVWRRSPSQARLSQALRHCVLASFDVVARDVGELLGRSKTTDLCDAHVAIVAAAQGSAVYTSDPNDLLRLVVAFGKRRPVIVRC
jgi:predicted nucleic acid-binding protein